MKNEQSCRSLIWIGMGNDLMLINWGELSKACLFRFFLAPGHRTRALWNENLLTYFQVR